MRCTGKMPWRIESLLNVRYRDFQHDISELRAGFVKLAHMARSAWDCKTRHGNENVDMEIIKPSCADNSCNDRVYANVQKLSQMRVYPCT